MMLTVIRLGRLVLPLLLSLALVQRCAFAFPSLQSTQSSDGAYDFAFLLGRDLGEEDQKIYRRQLRGLLESLSGLADPAGMFDARSTDEWVTNR